MSIRDELADLLDFHQPGSVSGTQYDGTPADVETCSCKQWSDTDGSNHREHVADAILTRFAVVELPEPAVDEWGNPDFSNEHVRLTVHSNGCVQLETPEYFGVNSGIHPFQLRDLAQRCLAAAKRAEAQS